MFIILIIVLYLNNYENLYTTNNFILNFIDKNEGCKILSNNKEIYLQNLQKKEMLAKKCIKKNDESNKNCIENYCKSAINWNKEQKDSVKWILKYIVIFLQKNYPKYPSKNWNIILTNGVIEDGLPHTRLNYIVFSNKQIEILVQCYKKRHIKKALRYVGGTMIHEHFHIFQKTHSDFFYKLYNNLWNFREVKNIKNLDKKMKENQRLNPDTIDKKWVYYSKFNNSYYYPLAILKDNYDSKLYDPEKLLLSVDKINNYDYSYNNKKTEIKDNLIYDNKFCKIDQIYHPNEISAVFWSQNILDEMKIKKLPTNRKICTNNFQEYMKKYLSYPI